MIKNLDVDIFSIRQMFNNSKGKTSGMLFICIYAGFTAVSCFGIVVAIMVGASVYALVEKVTLNSVLPVDILNFLSNIIFQSLALFTSALAGLGARRFTQDKGTNETENKEVQKDDV